MSTEVKYTPAPWVVSTDHEEPEVIAKLCTTTVAELYIVPANTKEFVLGDIHADAKLISAAPELLEALINVMSWIGSWAPNFTEDAKWPSDCKAARAAIAKAMGEI